MPDVQPTPEERAAFLGRNEYLKPSRAYPNSPVALQGLTGSGSDAFKAGRDAFITTVDQRGPGFSTSHGFDPVTGKMYQEFSESPGQAGLTSARERIAAALGGYGERLAGSVGTPDAVESAMLADLAGGRDAYEKATFDRAMALLGPTQARQERTLRNSLVNSGNPIGTERANFELDMLNRNQSAQRTDLALGAVLAGLQGQGQQISNLGNYGTARGAGDAARLANTGNLFEIMRADRQPFFAPGQLVGGNQALASATPTQKGSSPLGTIGTVAGGVIGGIYGGPAGAAAGASIGGAAGNAVGG